MKNNSFVRVTALALAMSQALMAVPIAAQSASRRTVASTTAPAAPKVTVNRKVPAVTLPPAEPTFSAVPTVEEIFRARVFAEPIVPVGGVPTAAETQALAGALVAFHRSGGVDWRESLGQFLDTHPASPWQASVLANVGRVELERHAYSSAFEAWDKSWALAKEATDPRSRAVADSALADWLALASSMGPTARIESRLQEITERSFSGSAGMRVARARETMVLVKAHPELLVQCGPEALLALLQARDAGKALPDFLTKYRGTVNGVSLGELQALAVRAGLDMRMAERVGEADVPVPSVIHLKVGHYATIVERDGDRYRVVDRARSETYWLDRQTLLQEASGYFLVPRATPMNGWSEVSPEDAATVRGLGPYCPDGSAGPGGPPPPPPNCGGPGGGGGGGGGGGNGPGPGMPVYQFQPSTASLILRDTPVGYLPPRGPALPFTLGYFHREVFQPQLFTFSNVGPKWTLEWVRFVKEEPQQYEPAHVWVSVPPGWREAYTNPDGQGVYAAHWYSQAVLAMVPSPTPHYERRLPDGTVETFGLSDGAASGSRRFFLTSITDPQGRSLTLTWDSQFRLVAMTDALGQVSTLHYDLASDPLKVTSIADPFNRSATFTYNSDGQLASITDVLGLTSSFSYAGDDFVRTLTTPYGATTFRHEPTNLASGYTMRFVEATDPLGATEHLEFQFETPSLSATAAAGEVPNGFTDWNTNLDHFNTFYWDKRAWRAGPGNLANATITHWLEAPEFSGWQVYSAPVPHSVKRPLEHRLWYAYPGQSGSTTALHMIGSLSEPSAVGRVMDDGSSQISQATYNAMGLALTKTDPLGRQTTLTYDTNGIDLLTVRQTSAGTNDLLTTYASYTAQHLPASVTDGAGQSIAMTYNGAGQLVTSTNALSQTTTYTYDSNGNVTSIVGPLSGASTTLTYDSYGRLRTVTDSDDYTLTFDYDVFDRLTRTSYADGTYEETAYDRLDVASRRDRSGLVTRYFYDALRRLVATRDPLGRVVTQIWCGCGSLDAIVDGSGNRTSWTRDLEGRITSQVNANSSSANYVYETSISRLKQRTDAKGQETNYQYALDDALLGISYANASTSTPSVTFTYDAAYGRLATMTDGIGTTNYSYVAAGTLGAGKVATVDGPLDDDTIAYTYDALGRVASRGLNGVTAAWTYDALGRAATLVDPIGTFTYTYDGATSRLQRLSYPNGQTSDYTYLSGTSDRRVQSILHKTAGGSTLSQFTYAYDAVGEVTNWLQQYETTTRAYDLAYDTAGQLANATYRTADVSPTILTRYGYAYDVAGNRTGAAIDDVPVGSTFDSMNRLTAQSATTALRFEGSVDKPSTVSIQGKPAVVDSGNRFVGTAPVTAGTNTITITATDASGNLRTQQYEVDIPAASGTFTYDANGSLTSHGAKTYEWDAENRLIRVRSGGTEIASFSYDGIGRRVQKVTGGVTRAFVYDGSNMLQERVGTSNVRHVQPAETDWPLATVDSTGGISYYLADHLGTIVQTTNASGAVTMTRQYDPFGNLITGAGTSGFAFTGREWDAEIGLYYYRARYYDPQLGRFLAADPLGAIQGRLGQTLSDGPNMYAYVRNSPIGNSDPSGLQGGAAAPAIDAVWSAVGKACAATAGELLGVAAFFASAMGLTQCGDGCGTNKEKRKNGCKPCVPPVGTIAYRLDVDQKRPHLGISGPHWHLFRMNQNPANCQCFWQSLGKSGTGPPPPNTVPIGPAGGGGGGS